MNVRDRSDLRHLFGVPVPMRDGTMLAADVHLPGPVDHGPYPTLLVRTPYGRQNFLYTDPADYFAVHGYAVVSQDVRGRFDSEGEFYPFFNNEGPDGYDTIEWIADQPWSTGRIGMFGGSYAGWVQWCAAAQRPPHLTTMVSASAAARWLQQVPFHNGVPTLAHLPWLFGLAGRMGQAAGLVDWSRVFMHLPLRTMDAEAGRELPVWREWLARPLLDDWWSSRRLSDEDFAAVTQPVLHITSSNDGTQPGALTVWDGARCNAASKDLQFMIFGAWDHFGAASPFQKRTLGGVDLGPESSLDVNALHVTWFDRWLRDDAPVDDAVSEPRARLFLTGVNAWFAADAWPPTGRELALHLASDGHANSNAGDGRLRTTADASKGYDEFVYDPNNPVLDVPTLDVYKRLDPLNPVESALRRPFVEQRDDVLVYTSDAFAEELTIAGEPRVALWGSSDVEDTEWHVWLADVAPDGESQILSRGQMGARFREGLDREVLLEPGTPSSFTFELLSLAHRVRPGHRLRLIVASSDFPTYCRHQNIGGPFGESAEVRVAKNRIHHGGVFASVLLLPVVEAELSGDAMLPRIAGGRSVIQALGLAPPTEEMEAE